MKKSHTVDYNGTVYPSIYAFCKEFNLKYTTTKKRLTELSWTPEEFIYGSNKGNKNKALSARSRSTTKLTINKVLKIRRLREEYGASYKDLAAQFNVSLPNIAKIIQKRSWV